MRFMFACLCLIASSCAGQGFTINTVAGDGVQGFAGDSGLAINAELFAIAGLAVDGAGNVYIADTSNNAIKKWTAASNTVSTLVTSG